MLKRFRPHAETALLPGFLFVLEELTALRADVRALLLSEEEAKYYEGTLDALEQQACELAIACAAPRE